MKQLLFLIVFVSMLLGVLGRNGYPIHGKKDGKDLTYECVFSNYCEKLCKGSNIKAKDGYCCLLSCYCFDITGDVTTSKISETTKKYCDWRIL
uniref:Sodium channel toxin meuNa8 n=1 Tax=Mesobuthus eupeus TaxID=34648 RepID=A0A146CIR7_MESEU|nr:sodium channel toxin meuNa8 [Mesobuthus eupeus]